MGDAIEETIRDQYDADDDECTIQFGEDLSNEDFALSAIPYTIGYVSYTHGVTDVSYVDNTITLTRRYDHGGD